MAASTVGRVIAAAGLPRLCELDALTGEPVRRGPASRVRYERERPASWCTSTSRSWGGSPRAAAGACTGARARPARRGRLGYDYVHSAVDDHTRLAYSEIHPDERGQTCAGFLARAAAFFAAHGITAHRARDDRQRLCLSPLARLRRALAGLGARHIRIRPHCPWQNGKVERFNRTLLREWAYARVFTCNDQRAARLPDWLELYNTRRRHSSLGGLPPISRLSTTW